MEQGAVVSIGTFDGIHLGHQAILHELRRQAEAHSLRSIVYAFSDPPRWALHGGEERFLLLPTHLRLEMLGRYADGVLPIAFESVCRMEPADFVETVLIGQLHAQVVVEGASFRFGRNRSGDLETLHALGNQMGLKVISVPPVLVHKHAVSSTRIRAAVRTGDFETARDCLGRSPALIGTVVRGDHLGSKMGFPSANLSIDPHVLVPHHGIYLVHATGDRFRVNGLLYIGLRPTLGLGKLRFEVHLLDFPASNLYGEVLEIHLLTRIREDRTFPSLDALRVQIEADIRIARNLLSAYPLFEERISS
ncbi:riboflavin biosynthesis protein RibF [Candidatus Bipolaricaulota bacterium]|nr:riboflavin biosynthesis protein RibF [Candidatus Bipolaricaulota bacterium]